MSSGDRRMTGISVIGAGVIGRVQDKNIAGSESRGLNHVADASGPNAERLADRFRAADREPAVEAVLADERVEAVVIASSTAALVEQVLSAAAAGKAVLLEKPFSDSPESARACASAEQGVRRSCRSRPQQEIRPRPSDPIRAGQKWPDRLGRDAPPDLA